MRSSPLTNRERTCVIVAAFFAVNRRAAAYDHLRRSPATSSLPTLFLQELFIHLSLVLGFPAMLEGLEFVRKVRPKPARGKGSASGGGKRILKRIYGAQTERLLLNIGRIHPEARSMILNDVYGKVFARSGLSLRERELINVTVLALQGLDRQLYSHLRGALRLGYSVGVLRKTLALVGRVSKRNMRTARSLLHVVVSQKKK